jgi:hypothetical protein
MNRDPIDRLLAAAGRCPPRPLPGEMPGALEMRVLAQWRSAVAPDFLLPWMGLLRRGLAASLALAAASLLLYVYLPKSGPQHELALADTLMQTQVWP